MHGGCFSLDHYPAVLDGASLIDHNFSPSGAQVELFREGKLASATTTDAEAKYQFSPLAPGRYQVRTQAPSFNSQRSEAIYLGSRSHTAVDLTLKVGTVTQQIVVSAAF
jgi:carboxypeptidase family protein